MRTSVVLAHNLKQGIAIRVVRFLPDLENQISISNQDKLSIDLASATIASKILLFQATFEIYAFYF